MEPTESDLERFWAKVDKTGECWLWTSQLRNGYGLFRFQGSVISAHRFSYSLVDSLEKSDVICHSCDTPACVRPDHLFKGTHQINMNDMRAKGRGRQALTNDQIADIRSRELTNTICRDLAEEFDVSVSLIKGVLDGSRYAWLPGAREVPPQFTGYKLSPEQVSEIVRELSKAKWGTVTKLAKKYGVSKGTISHINNERVKYSRTDTE